MQPALADPDYRAFVLHLIALRQRLGVSQAELARRLGKPQSYVSKSERFERRIDPAEFRLFVLAIGGDPSQAFAEVAQQLGAAAART